MEPDLATEELMAREFANRLAITPHFVSAIAGRLGATLDREEREDLAQNVALCAWRRRANFRGRSQLETWLHRICFFELMNYLRRRRRYRAAMGTVRSMTPDPVEQPPDDRSMRDEVTRALRRIAPIRARIIRLRFFESLTFEETATELGLPVNTVKSHFYRGLGELRGGMR